MLGCVFHPICTLSIEDIWSVMDFNKMIIPVVLGQKGLLGLSIFFLGSKNEVTS